MKFVWKYLKRYKWFMLGVMLIKLGGTVLELMIPDRKSVV